ncbi:MAG: DMT family transporter [Desulfobacterales bacterium]|nr:DMT family transporter [Desulfobacterales bacterium]
MNNSNLTPSAFFIIIFLCIIFGGNGVAIKFGLTGMGPFTSAAIRFAIAVIAIVCWARFRRISLVPSWEQIRFSLPHCIFFTLQLGCFHVGFGKTSASHGTLIANILPFVVMILAHFFIPGDRINPAKAGGVILGFLGVVFLFLDAPDLGEDLKQGDFIVLCAVLFWSCSAVYVKRIISRFNPTQLTLYPMIFCLPFYGGAALWMESPLAVQWNSTLVLALGYQSVLSAAVGMVAWNAMLNRYGATALHSFVFIIPLVGVVSGIVLLNEPLTRHLLFSVICIVVGILSVNLMGREKSKKISVKV